MDHQLLEEVSARLDSDPDLDPEVRLLIDAALLDELDAVVGGGSLTKPSASRTVSSERCARVYVGSISVAGFRGVGPKVSLDLVPGAGLTLVVGRNGSGKSSFAEGLELLLTGDNQRWSKRRNKEWQSGFRNLHNPDIVSLEAKLFIEGTADSSVHRFWRKEDALDGGTFKLTMGSTIRDSVDELGWLQALQSYRPFLSYNEIGSILEQGPSTLFDTLSPVLGLADLTDAANRLKSQQKMLKDQENGVKERLNQIKSGLDNTADPRSGAASEALACRRWKLEDLSRIVTGDELANPGSPSAQFAQLTQLVGPDLKEVESLAVELRTSLDRLRAIQDSDAERALRLMGLLEAALDYQGHTGEGDCPVCGQTSVLDSAWVDHTVASIADLRQKSEASAATQQALEGVMGRIRAMLSEPPAVLSVETQIEMLDIGAVRSAWESWAALRDSSPEVLSEALESRALELVASIEDLRETASKRREDLGHEWTTLALEIQGWIPDARKALEHADFVKKLISAEKRLTRETHAIRDDRFAPIKDEVLRYWQLLRTRSSVEISDLALAGVRTSRKVDIEVAVEGAKATALGVMSQGELHALVLSLYFHR